MTSQLELFGTETRSGYVEHALALQRSPELQTSLREAAAVVAVGPGGTRAVLWTTGDVAEAAHPATRSVLQLRVSDDDDCWFLLHAILRAKGVIALLHTA